MTTAFSQFGNRLNHSVSYWSLFIMSSVYAMSTASTVSAVYSAVLPSSQMVFFESDRRFHSLNYSGNYACQLLPFFDADPARVYSKRCAFIQLLRLKTSVCLVHFARKLLE